MIDPVKSNTSPQSAVTIEALLHGNALPHLELRILLAHALGMTRTELAANADLRVPADSADRFRRLVERREAGEPIAYLVGSREFYSLDFEVSPDVLIPRPETELVVDAVLDIVRGFDGRVAVLDLGTGSGAIAVAVGRNQPRASVAAVDVEAAALRVAAANARRHRVDVELVRSDWYEALDGRPFDVIASNPPYVAAADAHLATGDVRFEPRSALVGGDDGLEAIRRIVAGARAHLTERGRLVFEHGYDQGEAARQLMRSAGFVDVRTLRDLAGHERVCAGRQPPE